MGGLGPSFLEVLVKEELPTGNPRRLLLYHVGPKGPHNRQLMIRVSSTYRFREQARYIGSILTLVSQQLL